MGSKPSRVIQTVKIVPVLFLPDTQLCRVRIASYDRPILPGRSTAAVHRSLRGCSSNAEDKFCVLQDVTISDFSHLLQFNGLCASGFPSRVENEIFTLEKKHTRSNVINLSFPQAPCENLRTPSTYPGNMLPHHPGQANFEDFTC